MIIDISLSDEAVLDQLGARLLRQRLNQNLSQEDLAREAGVGVNTIYRLEQGESVQLTNLVRILRALGLIDGLDSLIPELPPSPVAQFNYRGKERKRASPRAVSEPTAVWKWKDDA
ncbi:MAG: helix-turn-helix domain-containing protein [Cyanobacteria bacterium SZAS TMP-1]|nr:helix-turn-helix domain-containing protein [Cyanobacteria bacterium SZAS TMP-1]